jgi:hypothetical protein
MTFVEVVQFSIRSLGPDADRKLANYFSGREIWSLNADRRPAHLVPYKEDK